MCNIEKNININLFVFLAAIIVICSFSFYGGFITGRLTDSQRRDYRYSGRDIEYGGQMGFAAELIGELDAGLGRIQGELSEIAVSVGQDANDLRTLASRLLSIGITVKNMEDDIIELRRRAGGFLSDLDNDQLKTLF
ncbi:MAG: hypothetical protein FWD47_11805 [Treponema sp.]|nr:hypothetical protein [Treponema sp.]